MIRILQQDNRATKAIFAVVIGAAIITMVITLVPGIFDNGAANNPSIYATVRTPGWLGRITGDSTAIKSEDVQRAAQQQMQQQQLPDFYLQFVMSRAGQLEVERAVLAPLPAERPLRAVSVPGRQVHRSGAIHQLRRVCVPSSHHAV
jgi:peptidyl-prolyl cis-trans isomerase D